MRRTTAWATLAVAGAAASAALLLVTRPIGFARSRRAPPPTAAASAAPGHRRSDTAPSAAAQSAARFAETPPAGSAAARSTPADSGVSKRLPGARGRLPGEVAGQAQPAPDLEALATRLPPEHRATWTVFRAEFPETDLTEVQQLHRALLARRARYGAELDEAEREEHARWVAAVEALSRALVELRAEELGLSKAGVSDDGRGYWLDGFQDSIPRYTYTLNANAAISTAVPFVRMNAAFDPVVGESVSGDGLYVNVNDHGTVYDENPEFQLPNNGGTRIVYKEIYDEGARDHSTHVCGTVGAWGYTASLMGMVPRVWIRSHIQQYTSDITGFGMATPGRLHTTTNPRTGELELKSAMGTTSLGNPDTNTKRGIYTSLSASYDSTLADYPYYIHFYAAGNNGTASEDTAYYTLCTDTQISKNVVTIGSVTDTARDASGAITSGGALAGSSSRGPTYDGRVKPDLVANGTGLISPIDATGFGSKSGTSMATPNASGSAALLIDYIRRRLPGHYFRSSTIRALLVNSADDRGLPGPDYSYGWGLVNVYRAAAIVKRHAENPAARVVVEDVLTSGQSWTAVYQYDGTEPIRVTLAWLDPPGEAQTQTTATRAPRLVNDLDLRIVGPGGTVYRPYVMPFVTGNATYEPFDHNLRNVAAETGVNTTDNVEQVYIAAPPAGHYTLEVSHTGSLRSGSQRFSLAVSGMAQPGPLVFSAHSVEPAASAGATRFALTVFGSGFPLGSDVLLRRAGSADTTAYEQIVVGNRIDCRLDTAALEKGFWDVVVRAPDGSESVLPAAFLVTAPGVRQTLYANDFESGADGLTLGNNWSVVDPNKGAVGGPSDAQQGVAALVTFAGGNYTANQNISAVLPSFSTVGYNGIRLEFQRWIGLRNNDFCVIEYSLNGTSWTSVNSTTNLIETQWNLRTYDLPAAVEGRNTVFIRFRLQTNASQHSFGWNIDDLKITGVPAMVYPPVFTSTPLSAAVIDEPYEYIAVADDSDTPGASLAFSASALPPGLVLTDNGDGTATLAGSPEVSGTFDITLSVTDGAYVTHQNFMLTVAKKTAAVTLTSLSHVYDGQPKSVGAATEPAGLAIEVTYDGQGEPPRAVGTYAVRAVVTDDHYVGEAEGTLTIAPAPLTLAADPKTKTVGAPDPEWTWRIVAGELFGQDAVVGAPVRESGETSGVYAIRRGTLDAGPNYALHFQESTLRILTDEGFVDANNNMVDDAWEARYWPDGPAPDTVTKRGVVMPLREVFVANLDPFDDESFFAITACDENRRFTFTTATDRLYTAEWTGDLRDPNSWRPITGWSDMPGTGAPMEAVAPEGSSIFIRVRVRLPPP